MMMPPVAVVRRAVPFLMWLPGLLWIAPPVAWLAWRSEFAAIAVAASVAAWIAIYRRQQAPLWYALLYPLGAAVVGFIMMRSAWRGGRRVEWRGRTYRVTASEAGGHIARQRDTDHDADGR